MCLLSIAADQHTGWTSEDGKDQMLFVTLLPHAVYKREERTLLLVRSRTLTLHTNVRKPELLFARGRRSYRRTTLFLRIVSKFFFWRWG